MVLGHGPDKEVKITMNNIIVLTQSVFIGASILPLSINFLPLAFIENFSFVHFIDRVFKKFIVNFFFQGLLILKSK